MLPRYTSSESLSIPGWNELSESVPVIASLAALAAHAWTEGPPERSRELSHEAKALLAAAAQRGIFELRTTPVEFESSDRMLAVCVERPDQRRLIFKRTGEPRRTLRYLEAFRELCEQGLVIHQLQKEFSLTERGFTVADSLCGEAFAEEFAFARDVDQ